MYIKVRVIPDSKREELIEEDKNEKGVVDHFKIYLTEPAERGLANKRVLKILQERFIGQEIRIINGHHSPSKLISIGND